MGRRKERRHAALGAAGRRVKLDLFAEPSGDTADSSTQEVGGHGNSKVVDELPSSPSSSGCCGSGNNQTVITLHLLPATVHYYVNFDLSCPLYSAALKAVQRPHKLYPIGKTLQNPLILLGQYSDDELDEGSSDGNNHALPEDASVAAHYQEKTAAVNETEDARNNAGNEPSIQNEEHLVIDSANGFQGSPQKLENGLSINPSEDFLGETNNMEEGPCLTAADKQPITDLSSGWKMVLHEESNQYYYWNIETGETSWEVPDILAAGCYTSNGTVVGGVTEESITSTLEKGEIMTRKFEDGSKLSCETNDAADPGISMGDVPDDQSKRDSFGDEDLNGDADQNRGTSSHCHISMVNGKRINLEHSVESEDGTDLPPQLVKHCEILLKRLNSLKSFNGDTEGQVFKLRCILEIEVRLADIKALEPCGSSLLPFWLHCEAHIKRMQATIDNFIKCSSSMIETDDLCKSHKGMDEDVLIDSSKNKPSLVAESFYPEGTSEKLKLDAQCNDAINTAPVAPVDVGMITVSKGTEMESKPTPEPDLQSPDEVDMDVDMEVEDTSNPIISIQYPLSELSNYPASQSSSVPGQILVGPLPVGEWVPPPPPEDEPFPPLPPDGEPFLPPPPDEPPEPPSFPPVTHSESVQPFPFTEHYTLAYPATGFDYYGQIPTEDSSSSLYMHPGGMQVDISHQPHYYEGGYAVPPVESSGYYSLQSGTLNATPITGGSATETSRTPSQIFPETQESDAGGSLLAHAGVVKLPGAADVQHPVETAANSSENINVSATSSNTTVHISTVAATTSKIQPKAPRGKKRTAAVISTLRPNKKVSSLVDKWKAVKEELHEEEEEPENAFEILEKKKQREIEEWRAQHIASGEASDNANFQPLGGDWRERVKRRMAQKKKETRKKSPDVATVDGNQQPDLVEISRGLPPGWQAYWDDSSKQVYYANMKTSETTWSRPTD